MALWLDPRYTVPNAGGSTRTCEGPRSGRLRFFHRRNRQGWVAALYLPRGQRNLRAAAYRYALAGWLTVPLGPDELGLHECDMPLCVKVCGMDRPRQDASVRSAVNRG